MKVMIDHLSTGLANALNFTRANRLVLVSELTRHTSFTRQLTQAVRNKVLGAIMERERIDVWDQPAARSAETAGWLALASLYYEGWDHVTNDITLEKKPPSATPVIPEAE
jgi:hypothetical protein